MSKRKKAKLTENQEVIFESELSEVDSNQALSTASEADLEDSEDNNEFEILTLDLESSDESDELNDLDDSQVEVFVQDTEGDSFLPESQEDNVEMQDEAAPDINLEGTELDNFETAEIEEVEFIEDERLESIIESILFASDRPVSINSIKMVFQGTNIKTDRIRKTLDSLAVEYAGSRRGITLEEAPGGYQLKTKIDNMEFLKRTLKARPFKLSGPALEVLAIVAYKQPCIKSEIDEIRGVESGHLLRALMEKGLANFAGKSDLPGKPMQYQTTKKFLEIFGLRSLKELPTLSQIDELIPEGIGDENDQEKEKLSDLTGKLSAQAITTYSEGEDELMKITDQLTQITTSSDFFEQEKERQRQKRDQEKAQNIREAITLGEQVSNRDINWLKRYDEALAAGQSFNEAAVAPVGESAELVQTEASQAGDEVSMAAATSEEQLQTEEVQAVELEEELSESDDFELADGSYDDNEAFDDEDHEKDL